MVNNASNCFSVYLIEKTFQTGRSEVQLSLVEPSDDHCQLEVVQLVEAHLQHKQCQQCIHAKTKY